jgi:rRNA-processing protein EBP2
MANKNKKKQQNKKRVEKPKEEVAKTTESSIFNNTTTIQQEPKVEWYRLEDLNEDEIDDPFGDMIIEQRLLLNNKVS